MLRKNTVLILTCNLLIYSVDETIRGKLFGPPSVYTPGE